MTIAKKRKWMNSNEGEIIERTEVGNCNYEGSTNWCLHLWKMSSGKLLKSLFLNKVLS